VQTRNGVALIYGAIRDDFLRERRRDERRGGTAGTQELINESIVGERRRRNEKDANK
jgi:hypothetical protein